MVERSTANNPEPVQSSGGDDVLGDGLGGHSEMTIMRKALFTGLALAFAVATVAPAMAGGYGSYNNYEKYHGKNYGSYLDKDYGRYGSKDYDSKDYGRYHNKDYGSKDYGRYGDKDYRYSKRDKDYGRYGDKDYGSKDYGKVRVAE
jgi:hypothetical protein